MGAEGSRGHTSWVTFAAATTVLGGGFSLPKHRAKRGPAAYTWERQWHEWRVRVDRAARRWRVVTGRYRYNDHPAKHWRKECHRFAARRGRSPCESLAAAFEELDAALTAPKPWRKA